MAVNKRKTVMRRSTKPTLAGTLTAILLLTISLAYGCSGSGAQSPQTIIISGAFALYPMVVHWGEEYQATHPNVQFDIQAGGAGKGMSDVLAGAVDIAMVSREVRPEEASQGAAAIGVAKDAVVATVNSNNPLLEQLMTTGLTPEMGASIWLTGETTTWGPVVGSDDANEIHVFTRSDSCGAAEVWALFLGGKAQEELLGIAVNADPGLAEAVRQDSLGIGYNNLNFAYDAATGRPVDGLRIIPIDLNGDGQITPDEDFYATKNDLTAAIAEGRYPSPPSRALYLVTKGNPTGAAAEFIRWVLTEGQAFVGETGYVQLTDDQLQAGLATLGE
jgi:phosphate transport system substrate-binding protein